MYFGTFLLRTYLLRGVAQRNVRGSSSRLQGWLLLADGFDFSMYSAGFVKQLTLVRTAIHRTNSETAFTRLVQRPPLFLCIILSFLGCTVSHTINCPSPLSLFPRALRALLPTTRKASTFLQNSAILPPLPSALVKEFLTLTPSSPRKIPEESTKGASSLSHLEEPVPTIFD